MNITKKIEDYDDKCIFFCETIKNNIINEGNFIRILYSTPFVTLNGIYLLMNLNDVSCEKYYNKYKCNFNCNTNKEIIDKIKIIEEKIIKKCEIKDKIPQYKIYDQIKNGIIKTINDIEINSGMQCSFILKISGIWETSINYGLTYKFIKIIGS